MMLHLTDPQTPLKSQMWIPKWKQHKKKELGYFFNSQHLWGKRGVLEFWDED
jgi:hypothetical protein